MLQFLILTLTFVAVSSDSSPSWNRHYKVHRNLQGLEPLLDAGTEEFTHAFSIDNEDTAINLKYQGKHHPNLFNLLTHPHVESIHCASSATSLTVTLNQKIEHFDTDWAARVGHPLTAVCSFPSSQVLYRKVLAVTQMQNNVVHIQCSKLELHDMFASLKLKMTYTPSKDEKTTPQKQQPRRLLSERKVRGLASVADVSQFIAGMKSLTTACTLKERRLGFMKDLAGKWKSEAKATWSDFSADVHSEFQSLDPTGRNRLECAVGPNLKINYNAETKTSDQEILTISPWATCHGCYFHAGIKVVVEIDIAATGLKTFVAYVEGGMRAKAQIKVQNPRVNAAGAEFTEILPPTSVGTLTFAVGSIPVKINIKSSLEMAATSNVNVEETTFTVGAQTQALWREGVQYMNGKWENILKKDVGYNYLLPEWDITPTNAVVTAHMRPVIELLVWETVPVIIKLEVDVSVALSTNNNVIPIGTSTSSAFCSDSYKLSWSMQGIAGVNDIISPPMTIKGKDLPQVTLVGGFVSDPFEFVGETEFSKCGKLCSGCFSDYVENKEKLVAFALPGAAPGEGGSDSDSTGLLTGAALAIVILTALIGTALLMGSVYLLVKTFRKQGRRGRGNNPVFGMRTTTTTTTKKTARQFPAVGGRTVIRT